MEIPRPVSETSAHSKLPHQFLKVRIHIRHTFGNDPKKVIFRSLKIQNFHLCVKTLICDIFQQKSTRTHEAHKFKSITRK